MTYAGMVTTPHLWASTDNDAASILSYVYFPHFLNFKGEWDIMIQRRNISNRNKYNIKLSWLLSPRQYGSQYPAETSDVVFGENSAEKTVIFAFGIDSKMRHAEVKPITPAPITAMFKTIFFLNFLFYILLKNKLLLYTLNSIKYIN